MHGYSNEEFLKLNVRSLVTPEHSELVHGRIERILAGDKISFEVSHLKKDGTPLYLDVSAGMIIVNGKKYVISIERDTTERRE